MKNSFTVILRAFANNTGVTHGRMFGSEGLKFGGKVFCMDVKGKLIVKLGRPRADQLLAAGLAAAFDPGHGRPMKQWLAFAPDSKTDWLEIAGEALAFAAGNQ